MLLSHISAPSTTTPTPEDIFASAISTIFTDDTVNSHGTPGSYITYSSPRFGDVKLSIPEHPDAEEGRKLFAHYLWNAGIIGAEGVEVASAGIDEVGTSGEDGKLDDGKGSGCIGASQGKVIWDRRYWDMRGRTALELGAATALPSLIAALSGAESCTITDHPSSPALTTGAIEKNVVMNLSVPSKSSLDSPDMDITKSDDDPEARSARLPRTKTTVQVLGYTWGTSTFYLPTKYGKPAPPETTPRCFDRIIIADCLWMPSQHINLIRTILRFLPPPNSETGNSDSVDTRGDSQVAAIEYSESDTVGRDTPCALVIAGFHTGRKIVADFFNLATEAQPSSTTPTRPPSSAEPRAVSIASQSQDKPTDQSQQKVLDQDPSADSSPNANDTPESSQPNEAKINTIPLDPSHLTEDERSVTGLLRLASIFEVDVDGNTRPWQNEREEEGKWEGKRWVVVGVLVRRQQRGCCEVVGRGRSKMTFML